MNKVFVKDNNDWFSRTELIKILETLDCEEISFLCPDGYEDGICIVTIENNKSDYIVMSGTSYLNRMERQNAS